MMLLSAIGLVVLAWIVVGGACVGWGAQLLALFTPERARRTSLPARFWAGFAVLLAMLQIWHLFLSVDWRATLLLLAGGWCALWGTGAWCACRAACRSPSARFILLGLGLWLAYRGLDYPRNYDSGLYHFASIRWANEFPAVPGLANLHDRLGFNQSQFLYVALLNVHPLTNEGYHAANGLLFLVLATQLLERIVRLRETPVPAPSSWVAAVMLPVAVSRAASGDLSSPTPDLAVFAVGVAAFLMALRATEEGDADFAALPPLLAGGCTLKLSFVVFAFALALGLIFAVAAPTSNGRRLWWFGICALAWGVPYAIHGVILSGYPAFPATLLGWPVDWRLPVEDARSATEWILAWARAPGRSPAEVLNSWQWLKPWWHTITTETAIPAAVTISGVSVLALVGAAVRRVSPARSDRNVRALFVPLLVALVFWFWTAPDPRFGDWLIWLATAWLAAAALVRLQPHLLPSLPRLLGPTSIAVAFISALLAPGLADQPRRFGWHSAHRLEVRTYETLSGLRVIVPAPGADSRLWEAPLPASPYEKPYLELRGAGLREGFRTRQP